MGTLLVPKQLSPQAFQILLSLSDKQLHGYAIIRDVKGRTGGRVNLTASTLYTAVKRMLRDGLLEESEQRPVPELDDERRVYYGITTKGKRVLRREAQWLHEVAAMARQKGLLA
jgi:DNA-binding PadR family transcriptional regulator